MFLYELWCKTSNLCEGYEMIIIVLAIFAALCLWRAIWLIKNPEKAQANRLRYKQKQLERLNKKSSMSAEDEIAEKRHQELLLAIYTSEFINRNK